MVDIIAGNPHKYAVGQKIIFNNRWDKLLEGEIIKLIENYQHIDDVDGKNTIGIRMYPRYVISYIDPEDKSMSVTTQDEEDIGIDEEDRKANAMFHSLKNINNYIEEFNKKYDKKVAPISI